MTVARFMQPLYKDIAPVVAGGYIVTKKQPRANCRLLGESGAYEQPEDYAGEVAGHVNLKRNAKKSSNL
jgi:hypothetical protein